MNAMTEERKKDYVWLMEHLCEMAKEPEKSLAFIENYEATHSEEDTKTCNWMRKMIYALSGNPQ